MDRRMTVEELERSLGEAIDQVESGGDEIIVERNGQPVAVFVSVRRFQNLRDRTANDLWELVEKNWQLNRDADPSEIEAAVDQAIREVRSNRRANATRGSSANV